MSPEFARTVTTEDMLHMRQMPSFCASVRAWAVDLRGRLEDPLVLDWLDQAVNRAFLLRTIARHVAEFGCWTPEQRQMAHECEVGIYEVVGRVCYRTRRIAPKLPELV